MDGHVRDFMPDTLAGIIAPGGWAPDKLWRDLAALARVREVNAAGGLVATICRGPWIPISDGSIVSSRAPNDLPLFGEAIVDWLDAMTAT